MSTSAPLRVCIIGGGLAGLCLANGLLRAKEDGVSIDVKVFERDTTAHASERGGYSIRMGEDGLEGLRTCMDPKTYEELKESHGHAVSPAAALIDPMDFHVMIRTNELKLYPHTRSVSRSILRTFLERKVNNHNALSFDKKLTDYQVRDGANDQEEIVVSFHDGSSHVCDILIAADGSRSKINDLIGLDNRNHTLGYAVIQNRGPVTPEIEALLPQMFKEEGAMLWLADDLPGFASLYPSDDADSDGGKAKLQLFWAINYNLNTHKQIDTSSPQKLVEFVQAQAKAKGWNPDGLPAVFAQGKNNVRHGAVASSFEPAKDWRAKASTASDRRKGNNRVFLVGDAMHAMSPGRGMGANQALRDAKELYPRLVQLAKSGDRSDAAIAQTLQEHEAEMIPRAFAWVKSSDTAFNLDIRTLKGFLMLKTFHWAVWTLSLGATALEWTGLKKFPVVSF